MKPGDQIKRLEKSLTNHTPEKGTILAIEDVRAQAKALGNLIILNSPASREQSLALTHLEETVMWAVKNLALNGVRMMDAEDIDSLRRLQ